MDLKYGHILHYFHLNNKESYIQSADRIYLCMKSLQYLYNMAILACSKTYCTL